jgi:pyruvate dehydrogenase E2 component (dihydrolipoamide acetyltransferase)
MASLILMPRLSPTMEEGVLAKWTKKEGDKIAPGDVIAEVETDKANMDFPLEDEGVLLKILVKEGETVKLGAPVAVLGEAGEDPASALAQASKVATTSTPPSTSTSTPTKTETKPETATPTPTVTATGRVKASPLARKMAADKGVDLRALSGSGPGGRIVAKDLEDAPAGRTAGYAPAMKAATRPRTDQLVPHSQMRKTIAKRLTEAKRDVPHFYVTREATADALFDLRAQYIELTGIKVSVNDLVIKALALALADVPDANASFTPEGIVKHGRIDISVAVSVPDGLITPVVRDADLKPLTTIAKEMKDLAERARAKKLKPEEYTGGTACVSNRGMFGVHDFTAIINPPEAVILAVGATEKRPVVEEHEGGDRIVIKRRMSLTLSCDHRVVDGALGAQLLQAVVKKIETPLALVL